MRKLFVGLGCGCVYPLVILLILAVISWYSLADAVSGIINPVELPQFSGPEQEDFWTLQEKRLTLVENHNETVILSPSEFNALLAGINFAPTNGFCLQRIRFLPGELNQGQLYLIGSGFFMRSLVFRIGVKVSASGHPEVTQIAVNSWNVPLAGMLRNQVERYLHSIFTSARIPEIDLLVSAGLKFQLDGPTIGLPAALVLKKR